MQPSNSGRLFELLSRRRVLPQRLLSFPVGCVDAPAGVPVTRPKIKSKWSWWNCEASSLAPARLPLRGAVVSSRSARGHTTPGGLGCA